MSLHLHLDDPLLLRYDAVLLLRAGGGERQHQNKPPRDQRFTSVSSMTSQREVQPISRCTGAKVSLRQLPAECLTTTFSVFTQIKQKVSSSESGAVTVSTAPPPPHLPASSSSTQASGRPASSAPAWCRRNPGAS